MLARLEQLTTLAWLSAIIGWLGWHLQHGEPAWAWIGAVVLAGMHGLWLALGCAMACWFNRTDPAPSARPAQWLRAWWGEVRAAPRVFCWEQPFRAHAEPDHLPTAPGGLAGVLLVHGYVCNRGLWNPWMRRLRREGIPYVAVNLEPVFGSIDDYVAVIESAVQQLERATGKKPLLLGHSMGGLAIRAWLQAQDADHRVQGIITLGTPHCGTGLAEGAFTRNGRQMRRGSAWLAQLAGAETASRRRLFLCCFSHCDNIVFPASTACLPGAAMQHLAATAHVDLVQHPWVWGEVLRRLGLTPTADHVRR